MASGDDAMMAKAAQTKEVISFGPFHLIASERLLTKDGALIELSSRALDILIVLLSRPNEIMSKGTLLSQVWPDVTVDEGSLRFHMTYLRKALGDGQGRRPVHHHASRTGLLLRRTCIAGEQSAQRRDPALPPIFPHANLPSRFGRMVGRDDDLLKLSVQLNASRFVTIVGAGGVGKTTLAIAVGHHLIDAFAGRRAVR